MDNNSVIKQLIEPTIELDELEILDVDEGTGDMPPKGQKTSRTLGTEYPLIQINDYVFQDSEIVKLEIDQTEFLPTLHLKVSMSSNGQFTTAGFPKDGDVASVFISGREDLFKPIRNDYLITDVATRNLNNEGEGGTITITGSLRIPKIYDEICISKEGSSFEVLKEIAQDLNLGFATNEDGTEDSMIWISTYDTYENFIHHIIGSSWKNEDSFFEAFIDVYYNLNFVNVNKMFNNDTVPINGLIDKLTMLEALDGEETDHQEFPLVFNNLTDFKETNTFITSYKVINNSSAISNKYGYKFHSVFFEQNSLKNWDIFSETLITSGSEGNSILLRGRANEDFYLSQIKRNWLGIQYSLPEHNVHDKFYFARSHNMMNNVELEKMNLEISSPRINLNIFKYERIPCLIFLMSNPGRNMINDGEIETNEEAENVSIDNFYSGFYLVKGMKFIFDSTDTEQQSRFKQKTILSRREWPNPFA